jgi:hypothetical protein
VLVGVVLLAVSFIAVTHHIASEPGVTDGAAALQASHASAQSRLTQVSPMKLVVAPAPAATVLILTFGLAVVAVVPVRRRIALKSALARRGPPRRGFAF